jgi:hypothetical protein
MLSVEFRLRWVFTNLLNAFAHISHDSTNGLWSPQSVYTNMPRLRKKMFAQENVNKQRKCHHFVTVVTVYECRFARSSCGMMGWFSARCVACVIGAPYAIGALCVIVGAYGNRPDKIKTHFMQ